MSDCKSAKRTGESEELTRKKEKVKERKGGENETKWNRRGRVLEQSTQRRNDFKPRPLGKRAKGTPRVFLPEDLSDESEEVTREKSEEK